MKQLWTRLLPVFSIGTYVTAGFFAITLDSRPLDAPTLFAAEMDLENAQTSSWGKKEIGNYLRQHVRHYSPDQIQKISHLISQNCKRYRFEPGLILSIIRVESGFRPDAISPAGAIGLMQIMPDTGEWLADRMGIEYNDEDILFDPAVNLRMGVHYLSYLRAMFNGDMKKVLVAYNRGPARVDEEMSQGTGLILGYYHKVRRNLAQFAFRAI